MCVGLGSPLSTTASRRRGAENTIYGSDGGIDLRLENTTYLQAYKRTTLPRNRQQLTDRCWCSRSGLADCDSYGCKLLLSRSSVCQRITTKTLRDRNQSQTLLSLSVVVSAADSLGARQFRAEGADVEGRLRPASGPWLLHWGFE